jgi:hypothetical protein
MDGSSIPLAVMSIYGKAGECAEGASGGVSCHTGHEDLPYRAVFPDSGERRNWSVALWAGKTGYSDSYVWHSFSAGGTVDIELKRR